MKKVVEQVIVTGTIVITTMILGVSGTIKGVAYVVNKVGKGLDAVATSGFNNVTYILNKVDTKLDEGN